MCLYNNLCREEGVCGGCRWVNRCNEEAACMGGCGCRGRVRAGVLRLWRSRPLGWRVWSVPLGVSRRRTSDGSPDQGALRGGHQTRQRNHPLANRCAPQPTHFLHPLYVYVNLTLPSSFFFFLSLLL